MSQQELLKATREASMVVDDVNLFDVFRLWWAELIGSSRSVQQADRIDQWLEVETLYGDLDFADVLYRLKKDLGVDISIEEFSNHFWADCDSNETWERCYAEQFTFGRFVELIAAKNPDLEAIDRAYLPVSFAPLAIAGKTCAPAGAFVGMQNLATNIDSQIRRFGPSCLISDVLKGSSRHRFWRSLRIQSNDSVPPLVPYSKSWWVRFVFAVWYVCGAMVAGIVIPNFLIPAAAPIPLLAILSVAHAAIIIIAALVVDELYGGFIPRNLRTFRDLAEQIATASTPRGNDPA